MSTEALVERLLARYPRIINLDFSRLKRLLDRMGNPERRLPPVVHVAGTNGKGSLCAYVRAMAEAAGYRVHVFTSPHLVRFNERIRLAGAIIDDDRLAAFIAECEAANGDDPLAFFEIITAAALNAFATIPAELLVLEVGLGGRFDATNVVEHPAVSAITPIGIDHTGYLGDTLEKIAGEKAGIIKAGAPVVVGRQREAPARVIEETAQSLNAPLFRMGREWTVTPRANGFHYESALLSLDLPAPSLAGAHQLDNASTAIACVERLRACGMAIDDAAVRRGLSTVEWPARLQRLLRGPLPDAMPPGAEIWLDGGHNEDCGVVLGAQARAWAAEPGALPLHLVFGMMTTKDASGFLRPLARHAVSARAVPIPGHAAFTPQQACAKADEVGLRCLPADDVQTAVEDLLATEPGPFRILVCGSLYLAGEVLKRNG